MTPFLTPPGIIPTGLIVDCPPAAQGQTTNATGDYDPRTVASAAHASAAAWGLSIALIVFVCYNWTRVSLSPRFVVRWWVFLIIGAVVGAAVIWGVLTWWPTTALANACQSDPRAFPAPLPGDYVVGQAVAGGIYGALLFALLSVVFTKLLGRFAHHRNGFFHNSGCPVPRVLP